MEAQVDTRNVETCHGLKSDDNDWSNKVIVKFSKGKDIDQVKTKRKPWKMVT